MGSQSLFLIKMLVWIYFLCMMEMVDGRYLGNRINRRYGGRPKHTVYSPRPGSYAFRRPFEYPSTSYYPMQPHVVSYQDRVHQQQKQLDLFIDHSGHVDADSMLFPHPNDIPTVFIPSNARALQPAMRVFPQSQGLHSPPQPPSSSHPMAPPLLSPLHAHISMMHPSYESGSNQHHHNEINEVSYAYKPLDTVDFSVPPPPPMKNYLDMSNSYASVVHTGADSSYPTAAGNSAHYPPSPQHHPLSASASSHYPETLSPVPNQLPIVPQAPTLPYYPGHFSHNNPLGTVTCCDDSWNPLKPVPEKDHQPSTKEPMSIYLPAANHEVEAESQAFTTIVSLNSPSNETLHSNSSLTVVVHDQNQTTAIQTGHSTKAPSSTKPVRPQKPKAIVQNQQTPPKTTILMLSPHNDTSEIQSDPLPTRRPSIFITRSTPAPMTVTSPSIPIQPSSDVGATGSLPQDSGSAVGGFGTITSETSSVVIPSDPIAQPQFTRPVSSPAVLDDEIVGIPGDIIPVDPAADPAAEGGGNGLVNVFTQFLDELANIIETFSPTELPLADPGVASDPGVGGLGDAGQSFASAAVEGASEGANAVGTGVEGGVGGLTEGTSGLVSGGTAGIDGVSGVAEGVGSVAEGAGTGAGAAGNEVPASSQLSASGIIGAQDAAFGPMLPNRAFGVGDLAAFPASMGGQEVQLMAQSALSPQFPAGYIGQGQPTPLYLNPMNFPQFAASFVKGVHSNTGEAADPAPETHPLSEPADPEPFHMDIPAAEVHHAESEPIPESNTLVRDHFVELPISEVVPSPEFVPHEPPMATAESEPHPHISHSQQHDSYKDSREEYARQNYQSSYNDGNKEEKDHLVTADSQPLSSHYDQSTSNNGPLTNPLNFQLLRYTDSILYPLGPAMEIQSPFVPHVPEVIAASSAVRHYTQGRNPLNPTDVTLNPVPQTSAPLSTSSENIFNPYNNLNFNPDADIKVKGEIGQLSHSQTSQVDITTEKEVDLSNEEGSRVREYLPDNNSITESDGTSHTNSFEREEDNIPEAEGIPADIFAEVQSNINLDLLKTKNK